MQQRYYDPQVGQFLTTDPVAAEAGLSFNRYRYANSSPYRFTDPDGRVAAALTGVPSGVVQAIVQEEKKNVSASPEMKAKIIELARTLPSANSPTEARIYINPDLTSTPVTTNGCTDHSCNFTTAEASSGGASLHLHNSIGDSKSAQMAREFPTGKNGDFGMVNAGSVSAVKTPSGAVRILEGFFNQPVISTISGGNPSLNKYVERNWSPNIENSDIARLAASYRGPYP